jgi:four helix bundle protein
MSNIAEGFERRSDREFLQFLKVANGSAGEVRSQLYIAEDVGMLQADIAQELRQDAALLSRQIAALITKVRRR